MELKELWSTGQAVSFVVWCSGCSAEQAMDTVEVEIDGQWTTIDVGLNCLTRLKEEGRIEE